MRKLKTKPSLRETLESTEKAMRFHAAMSGKPFAEEFAAPARRAAPTKRTDDDDTEAAVIREITAVIAHHPRVLFAVRQNSGAAVSASGAPIWFYRIIKLPADVQMTVTDFWGVDIYGKPFCIEAKRRAWTKPSDDRERKQLAFIEAVRSVGGVAGFATSGEQARNILEL